jgi:hypothetical protein
MALNVHVCLEQDGTVINPASIFADSRTVGGICFGFGQEIWEKLARYYEEHQDEFA